MQTEYYLQIAPATIRGIVEILAVLLMLIGLVAVVWHRLKQGLGLSNLSLQFVSVIFVFPTVLILSLEGVLKGETAGTLIGTLAGYLFSEFGKNRASTTPKPAASIAPSPPEFVDTKP
jgi:hypothetical protein